MSRELGRELFAGFSTRAMERLKAHPWPGNVRELKNVVERAVYRLEDPRKPIRDIVLDPFDSPWQPADPSVDPDAGAIAPPDDLRAWLDEQEKRWVERALAECDGNRRRAAERLGLSYDQLRGILRKHA
jgi:psp operon transcriptional activator